jgi:ADP-ribosylation factor GTPase-activating protein 1
MAVDPVAVEFFNRQLEDPENCFCCDGGEEEATWVSVSHGIYLSMGAAGVHRSLGVKTSFVQSTIMDSWRPKHLKIMELGGNRRFNEFLKDQGIPLDMPIREKYSTRAAEWYREDLNARAEGLEPLPPLTPGTGHLPAVETCPRATQNILDEVFAVSPRRGSMTRGGVRQSQIQIAGQESASPRRVAASRSGAWQSSQESINACTKTRSSSICEKLTSCFRRRCSSIETESLKAAEENLSSEPGDASVSKDLPTLLCSSPCSNAKRLQLLSTGTMTGLSSDDFPVHLAAPEEISCQVEK